SQRLALLQFGIDRLKEEVPAPATDFVGRLDELRKQLAETSTGVQTLSRELHSPTLDILRIDKSLRALCADFNKRLNMEIDFNSRDVPRAVPSEVSLGLFRVLQEALQNSATHSGTRYAVVELEGLPGEIHMRVKDFGNGFTMDSALRAAGLGLVTMRERVALVKGTFSIRSAPGEGTEIDVRVPVQ